MRPIYVCLATDDNYAPLASVAIASLLNSNSEADSVKLFILDSDISQENKKILSEQVECKGRSIHFIDVSADLEELRSMGANAQGQFNSFASYARFFIIDHLPEYVDKLLYIDCDTCVCGSLQSLFSKDLGDSWFGAVIDILPDFHKEKIGFERQDWYFNAGVIMFDCHNWKENHVFEAIINHLKHIGCKYSFHDQDIINLVCKDHIMPLPPHYMTFLPEYSWGSSRIIQMTDLESNAYYSNEELIEAAENPCIIHYVECIFGRPWYNGHRSKYFEPWNVAFKNSPYHGTFRFQNKKKSIGHKILEATYYILPRTWFISIYKARKNKALHRKENLI